MPKCLYHLIFILLGVCWASSSQAFYTVCPDMSHNSEVPPGWTLITPNALPQSNNLFRNAFWNSNDPRGVFCNYNLEATHNFFQLQHEGYKPHDVPRTGWRSVTPPFHPCDSRIDAACKCKGNTLEDCKIKEND